MKKSDASSAPWWQQIRLGNTSPWPLVAIGLTLIGAGLGWDLYRQYQDARGYEAQRLNCAAQLIAQSVVQRLASTATLLNRLDAALAINPADATASAVSVSALESQIVAVLSIDDAGHVVASSRPEYADIDLGSNEALYAARADADVEARLHVAVPPATLASSGQLIVRARRSSDGSYTGASAVLLAPDYFEAALSSAGGQMSVRLEDGQGNAVLTRANDAAANSTAGGALTAGATVSSTLVPLDRPWTASVWRTDAELRASWSRQARFGLLLWLGVALVAVAAGVIASVRRAELRKLRTLHRRLLQGADEGIVGVDLNGRMRFANPAFARACGATPGDLLGQPAQPLLRWSQADEPAADNPLSDVLTGVRTRFEGYCEIVGAEGAWRVTISPTREGGALVGALLSFVDPAASPDAGGPTRGPAERLYRTLFDLSPDGIMIVDLESEQPLSFNAAAHRQLGYGADEFGRMRIREHEASAAPMDTIRHIARVVAEGRVEFETRYRGGDGVVRDVTVIAQTIDFAGRAALYWVVRDITARKTATNELRASEALRRTLIERLPLPLLVFEGEQLGLVNARALDVLGEHAAVDQQLQDWLQAHAADSAAQQGFEQLWQQLTHSPHAQGELALRDGSGATRVFDLHLARIDARTLVLLVDLSERRLAEQRLTEARALAERAQRARNEFLANMSHEIRTPMTTILGLGYLLQKSHLDSVQRDQVQKIDSGARTLLAILDDVLDYAKLETGRIRIEHREFSLRAVVDDIHLLFAAGAQAKGLRYQILVDAAVPNGLVGDPVRLRQVLFNLVGNAVKFTERGAVELTLGAEQLADARVNLVIEVRDTGIGIDAEKLDQIFEPFYQGEAAASRRFGGTGLGLPISRWLIDLMGGQLHVHSSPGAGSEFCVRLPLELAINPGSALAAGPLPDAPQRPGTLPARELEGVSVLLVEDHPVNRQVACEILVGVGARVSTAADGQEAIDTLRAEPDAFQVVLMDLQMPTIDGFEATRRIRSDLGLHQLPIIAMTANASADDRAQTQAAGMNDHLAKPVDVASLVATVRHYAGRDPHPAPLRINPAPAPARLDGADSEPLPVLALERALARLADNRQLYAQMARLFVQEHSDVIRQLRDLAHGLQWLELERAAHGLKGVAATLGAERLADAAGRLEHAARKHKPDTNYLALITATDTELVQAMAALTGAVAELTPDPRLAVAPEQFDAAAFSCELDRLVAALADDNMAAVDHYAALRSLATDHLLELLRPVEDALARLDFGTALEACRRAEDWLSRQPGKTDA